MNINNNHLNVPGGPSSTTPPDAQTSIAHQLPATNQQEPPSPFKQPPIPVSKPRATLIPRSQVTLQPGHSPLDWASLKQRSNTLVTVH
jgi:hypothetical protein